MPYIIVTSWFPLSKGTDVAEKYIEERKKFPPDKSLTKEVIQSALKVEKNKVKAMYVAEVKEGKLDEALARQQNALLMYHDIEGYEYTIEIFFNIIEAMGMIGMKAPE